MIRFLSSLYVGRLSFTEFHVSQLAVLASKNIPSESWESNVSSTYRAGVVISAALNHAEVN